MTRPISEPTTQRAIRGVGFSADQLFRRPGPSGIGGLAIYEIKVFEDNQTVEVIDDQFVWEIPEDLDLSSVVKVEAYISTAGADDTVIQIRSGDPCDPGTDILTTPITIDAGECNSKDASVQPVIDGGQWDVVWGDHLHIDIDSDGDGAMGLGVIVTLSSSALASVVLEGAEGPQGPPGGIVVWMGEWDSGTTYDPNDAVSHNGSSYVAINTNTNVEPGVDAGWETDWMLLAEGATPTLSYLNYTLGAAVTMTSANTFYNGPSGSFTAGTWLVNWKVEMVTSANQTQAVSAHLWDGTNIYDEQEVETSANGAGSLIPLVGFAIITLGSTQTLTVRVINVRANNIIARDISYNSGNTHTASRLTGVQIA